MVTRGRMKIKTYSKINGHGFPKSEALQANLIVYVYWRGESKTADTMTYLL